MKGEEEKSYDDDDDGDDGNNYQQVAGFFFFIYEFSISFGEIPGNTIGYTREKWPFQRNENFSFSFLLIKLIKCNKKWREGAHQREREKREKKKRNNDWRLCVCLPWPSRRSRCKKPLRRRPPMSFDVIGITREHNNSGGRQRR